LNGHFQTGKRIEYQPNRIQKDGITSDDAVDHVICSRKPGLVFLLVKMQSAVTRIVFRGVITKWWVSETVMQTSAMAAATNLRNDIKQSRCNNCGNNAYQMMTTTLNLTNSVNVGMIPTAMEVPMDATVNLI